MPREAFEVTFPNTVPADLMARAARLAAAPVPLVNWLNNIAVRTVFQSCANNPGVFPNAPTNVLDEYIVWWFQKYVEGFAKRASLRRGGLVTTINDPAVRAVIEARTVHRGANLDELIEGHRLAMAAENIVGDLLEEYVAVNVGAHGWYCAWGSTMRDIDFCSLQGVLLQVKNRDNSENNASRRVRAGTQIRQWHRGKSRTGATRWPGLVEITGCPNLNEQGFLQFVRTTLANNAALLV